LLDPKLFYSLFLSMLKIWNCLIVLIFLFSCDGRNYIDPKNTQILAEHKMNFPKESTDHFPQQLGSEVDIIYNEGIENNNLNLYLVEHNVSEKYINKLLNRLKDTKYYRGGDKNLLIINRNEKIIEGFSEFPKIDSANLQGDAPVPNFIRYKNGITAVLIMNFILSILTIRKDSLKMKFLAKMHQCHLIGSMVLLMVLLSINWRRI